MKSCFLIFAFILSLTNPTRAQSYSSVHYDTKDGLPSATIYDITQDSNGFVWFGTENGLCRFDGKNFKTFTTKDGLPDNSILKVHGDNVGRLYFTPFTHSLYYFENDSFHKFPIPEKYREDLSEISIFFNSGAETVVCGTINSYWIRGNRMISFHDDNPKVPQTILVNRTYDSLIVTGTLDSIYLVPRSGNVKTMIYDTAFNMMFDSAGQFTKLHFAKYADFRMVAYLGTNLLSWSLRDTLRLLNCTTGDIVFTTKVDKFSKSFIDNENNLWISTLGNGVYRFPSFGFRNMDFDGKNEIFSIAKTKDQILAGSDYSTLYRMSGSDDSERFSTTNLSRFIDFSDNPISYLTKRNRIYVLYSEGNTLYAGTDAFLMKNATSSAPVFKNIFPIKDIDLKNKRLLVCTGRYVVLLDEADMSVKDTLLRQRSTCGVIYHGNYFIGTLGGLIMIDSSTKKITELYKQFPSLKGRITAIKRGVNDDVWIATSGSGLSHFKGDKVIRILREKDGLTSNICTSLYVDGDLLWLGTNNGLNRIQTENEKIAVTRFTSANGLGADFINAVLATDSIVCVGTAAGLSIFRKNIMTEKSICILHVLQVSENGTKLERDSSYTFPYDALNVQVDFTAVSFKSAGDITYSYQLHGLDNKWNTTTANFLNFPTLQPDDYTLLLKATNKFGVVSNVRTIKFRILPPWWQTWSFRIIALLAIGLLVLLIYRFNVRNIKRKEKEKREIETRFAALEQQALQAQMNPHFIFNCLNSIQTFILNLDAEGANAYLTNFASLIRQTLENSMQPLITVASEVKYLETYLSLEKLRFREKFAYKIRISDDIDQGNTLLPGMLLQPYIENSIRHGIQHRRDNNGLVLLSIGKTDNNAILYTIKDNGVGRKKAEELKSSRHIEYQSRGMFINEKRIAVINNQFKTNIRVKIEDILDENGMVAGTSVTILIPQLHKQ